MGVWLELARTVTRQAAFGHVAGPAQAQGGFRAWYRAVTPSSLKRAAMVPNTGISRAAW